MFSNWMLQSKDSIRKNFKNLTISLKRATCFNTKASRGNLAPQSPRGNMHKLSDCIRTPLKRFLACLPFHRKKIRLRHLHKRTSTESAPVIVMRTTVVSHDWKNDLINLTSSCFRRCRTCYQNCKWFIILGELKHYWRDSQR